jgi:hypothetical protein
VPASGFDCDFFAKPISHWRSPVASLFVFPPLEMDQKDKGAIKKSGSFLKKLCKKFHYQNVS